MNDALWSLAGPLDAFVETLTVARKERIRRPIEAKHQPAVAHRHRPLPRRRHGGRGRSHAGARHRAGGARQECSPLHGSPKSAVSPAANMCRRHPVHKARAPPRRTVAAGSRKFPLASAVAEW